MICFTRKPGCSLFAFQGRFSNTSDTMFAALPASFFFSYSVRFKLKDLTHCSHYYIVTAKFYGIPKTY